MIIKSSFYIRVIIFTVFLILVLNQNLVFEPWDQVEYLSTFNWLEPKAFINVLPHFPRFSIVYPCYLLEDILGININFIYGAYIISLLNLTSILWQRIAKYLSNSNIWPFLCSIFPLLLSFIINGRFAFGLLGITLIIYKAYYKKYNNSSNNNFIIEFIGLYFSAVSSGLFLFGLSFFLIINSRKIIKSISYQISILMQLRFNKKNSFKNTLETLYLLFIFVIFSRFLIKNFEFFGGFNIVGLNGLLSHGIGAIFSREFLIQECASEDGLICNLIYLSNANPIINLFL